MAEFLTRWTNLYPSALPVAHLLRNKERDRWIRFYSLPKGKRYATTKREAGVILDRANQLASHVLGEGSDCWLVQALNVYGDALLPTVGSPPLPLQDLDFVFSFPSDDRRCLHRIYAGTVRWSEGAFDRLLSQVADDRLGSWIMWISASTDGIFAPYDGGTDLFLRNPAELTTLRSKFRSWLSDRADGL